MLSELAPVALECSASGPSCGKMILTPLLPASRSSRLRCRNGGFPLPYKDPEKARAYREAHHAEKRAYAAEYYIANRDQVRAAAAAWRLRHPEKIRAASAAYRATHPNRLRVYDEAYREKRRATYAANPEGTLARNTVWRAAHPEACRARAMAYNAVHREQNAERLRKWTAAHPERIRAIAAASRARHPETSREKTHRRRARIRNQLVEPVDARLIYERDKGLCHICGKRVNRAVATLDHLLPISLGGAHAPWNVALAHRFCNSRRGVRGVAQLLLALP